MWIKWRKGAMSLVEVIFCLVITTMIIVILMATMAKSNFAVARERNKALQTESVNYIVEQIEHEIKSCDAFEVSSDYTTLTIHKDGEDTEYGFVEDTITRNDETVITGVISGLFEKRTEDSLRIKNVRTKDEQLIDIVIHR